jgi:DNA-binding CsgD family transcriptional regulator
MSVDATPRTHADNRHRALPDSLASWEDDERAGSLVVAGPPAELLAEPWTDEPWDHPRLSPQEKRVAELAGANTNDQIAARLSMTARAVKGALGRVYHKLDVHSRAELGAMYPACPEYWACKCHTPDDPFAECTCADRPPCYHWHNKDGGRLIGCAQGATR